MDGSTTGAWVPGVQMGTGMLVRLMLGIPALLLFLRWYIKRRQYVQHMYSIPGPTSMEIFKDSLKFLGDTTKIFRFIQDQRRKYGGLYRVWMFNRAQILCSNARDAEIVLKGSTNLTKSSNYSVFRYWMGIGLFTMQGEEWRQQRKALQPLFLLNSLQNFIPIWAKHASKMEDLLSKRTNDGNPKDIDVFAHTCMVAFDVIAETTMGIDVKSQEKEDMKFIHSYNNVMRLTLWRYLNMPLKRAWIFWFSPTRRELDKAIAKINVFTDKLINKRKKYLNMRFNLKEKVEDDVEDDNMPIIFDACINSRTHDEIRKDFRAFTFAGYDTVATGLGWLLFLIAENEEVQDRIVEEMEEIFGDSGRVPDSDDITNMKYLECAIKESLRLYPSAPFFERTLSKSCKLGDKGQYEIPAGTDVTFDLFALHRDPEWWGPDPEKFDPDRFMPENSIGRHPYAFLAFCVGPRSCLGQVYAMLEMKVIVSTLLRRFRLEAAHALDYNKLKVGILLRPKGGLKIRVYERTSHPKLRMLM